MDKTPDILIHTIADLLGKTKNKSEEHIAFIDFAIKMYEDFINDFSRIKSLPPLLTGKDLINIFYLEPSPLFKKILNSIEKARLEGKVKNKKQAFIMVEKILSKQQKR